MGKLAMMVTNKLTCRLVGHDLEVTKEITEGVKEYKCKRCHSEFTTTTNGTLTDLTQHQKERNVILEKMFKNRKKRQRFNNISLQNSSILSQ